MITKVTVGTTAALVLAEGERKGFILSNHSDSTVYVSIGGEANVSLPAGSNPGMPLAAGAVVVATVEDRRSVPVNQAIYAIGQSAGRVLSVEVIP